jgi:flavin reductase (DIM6/NTAB) family NADH-FMN oxidoreductase RutF
MSPEEFTDALSRFSTGVTIVSVRDERDDLASVATSFMSASLRPPLVAVSLANDSYLAEVMARQDLWAASVLGSHQKQLAGRFAASGRPSPRLLLSDTPNHRGPNTDALVIEGGLTALECRTTQRLPTGDHTLVIAEVIAVAYVGFNRTPLLRYAHAYRNLA